MPELITLPLFSDANLQAYYRLEDTSDSKNSNTLTNNNSVSFAAAKFGNGADMGSSDANKTLSRTTANGYTNAAYAVSQWVKINTEPSSGVDYSLVHVYGTTTQFLMSYLNESGTRKLRFTRFNGSVDTKVDYAVDLGTTELHHIVNTYDGTNMRLYLDNVLVGGPSANSGATGSNTPGFVIGGQPNDLTANNALAIFDDVACFDRNLTAAEVTSIYSAVEQGGYFYTSV